MPEVGKKLRDRDPLSLVKGNGVYYLGIDPGKTGGVGIIDDTPSICELFNMPATLESVYVNLHLLIREYNPVCAVLEYVTGYIGGMDTGGEFQQGSGPPGGAMFNFGVQSGACEMALIALGFKFKQNYFKPQPHYWHTQIGAPKREKKEKKAKYKGRLRDFAAGLFPTATVTVQLADAALLARYCRQVWYEKCYG
jgi:hypothetical protein